MNSSSKAGTLARLRIGAVAVQPGADGTQRSQVGLDQLLDIRALDLDHHIVFRVAAIFFNAWWIWSNSSAGFRLSWRDAPVPAKQLPAGSLRRLIYFSISGWSNSCSTMRRMAVKAAAGTSSCSPSSSRVNSGGRISTRARGIARL